MDVKLVVAAAAIGFVCSFGLSDLKAHDFAFGDILFPGANETMVFGLNDNGTIVGAYGASIDIRESILSNSNGFIFDGDKWESLEAFGSLSTTAHSINNDGIVIGHYLTADGRVEGFVFDGTEYFSILPPGAQEATISDIDDNGVIIGTFWTTRSLSVGDQTGGHGFRAFPDESGKYEMFMAFDFPFMPSDIPTVTSTLGNGRNNAGVEVGTGIIQNPPLPSADVFGFVLPQHTFRYTDVDAFLTFSTQLVAVNDNGIVIGNAQLLTFELNGRNQSFLLNVSDFGGPEQPTPHLIDLPGPACGFVIDILAGTQGEPCRPMVANINDHGQIVGFYDNDDGIQRGFKGTPLSEGVNGDYNNDGIINAADYTAWRDNRGTGTTLPNDVTPGTVDDSDYEVWKANFGMTGGNGSAQNATIPEPASWLLILIGVAAVKLLCHPARGC